MTPATACPPIHFRPDGCDMTRTACDLLPWEVEPAFATSIGERVTCVPCNVGLDARHRQRELDDFYAPDLEHDQADPLWEDRRARLGLYQERENGGLSQADLPLTPAERRKLGMEER